MKNVNIITRRSFFDRSFKLGMGVALSSTGSWVQSTAPG